MTFIIKFPVTRPYWFIGSCTVWTNPSLVARIANSSLMLGIDSTTISSQELEGSIMHRPLRINIHCYSCEIILVMLIFAAVWWTLTQHFYQTVFWMACQFSLLTVFARCPILGLSWRLLFCLNKTQLPNTYAIGIWRDIFPIDIVCPNMHL